MLLQEFGARTEDEGGMATYQAQLSLGLHILVMMGTFFAAGFYGVSYVSPEPLHVSPSSHDSAVEYSSCMVALKAYLASEGDNLGCIEAP